MPTNLSFTADRRTIYRVLLITEGPTEVKGPYSEATAKGVKTMHGNAMKAGNTWIKDVKLQAADVEWRDVTD